MENKNNMKKEKISEIIIAITFILIGASARLLPHPANFTPISAIALFGGVYLSRKTALVLPLAAMAISDIFIGYYDVKLMIFVYGSFILSVILGSWLKKHKRWHLVFGSSILSAFIFFFITNFAVWAFTPWYAKNFTGIIQCYFMALPFLKNSLMGDLFYTFVFFGSYELIKLLVKNKLRESKEIIISLR